MYTEILVPLDGSPIAEQVLPYARLFATTFGIPIELLCVVDPEMVHSHGTATVEGACAESLKYLEGVPLALTGQPPSQCTIERGNPAEKIVAVAAVRKDALIAMSTHGRSGVQRWLLGSIAEKTVQTTTHPLLLIRGREKRGHEGDVTLSKLLVPLDGSSVAEQVLPHVVYLAKTMGLEVILLRAYEVHVRGQSVRMRQIGETVKQAAQVYLDETAQRLKAQGVEAISLRIEHGNAADRIVSVAQELSDNFIAMSTHGHSGVRRWVLGNVTSRIVRHSNDPVFVIRATSGGRPG
jgi:nucleotide-binding universal stress UspA family protein